jgi:hypothetical protein
VRLWSIHPRGLDARGLTAAWREGLLARAVLRGRTRGYRSHPQLDRFRACADPVAAIDAWLAHVLAEARERGYRFDARKIRTDARAGPLRVTDGQVRAEWAHLLGKLFRRDRARHARLRREAPAVHPLFDVVRGGVAPWERAFSAPRTRPSASRRPSSSSSASRS